MILVLSRAVRGKFFEIEFCVIRRFWLEIRYLVLLSDCGRVLQETCVHLVIWRYGCGILRCVEVGKKAFLYSVVCPISGRLGAG